MGKGTGAAGRLKAASARASEFSRRDSELLRQKPPSLARMFGSNGPTPAQAAEYKQRVSSWNSAYRKNKKQWKAAIEESNTAFRAKQAADAKRKR